MSTTSLGSKEQNGKNVLPLCCHGPWELHLCPSELSLKHSSDGLGTTDTAPESGAGSLFHVQGHAKGTLKGLSILGWHQTDQSGMEEGAHMGVFVFWDSASITMARVAGRGSPV